MSQTGLAQGNQSNGGGGSSVTSLKEPVRLWKPSNMLELMRRVVLTMLESSMGRSLHLHPADLWQEKASGHACEGGRPLETLPGHPGLTPSGRRVSWWM